MGFDKMTARLTGEPVLRHTVRAFERCESIRSIHVVTAAGSLAEVRDFLRDCRKLAGVIEGGTERHFSVWNGLRALAADAAFVAVHDGARALATPALIARCVAAAEALGAASAAAPVTDTLKRAEPAGRITGSVDRAGLWAMQTPQVFSLPLLRRAYEAVLARGESVTDETSAVEALGEAVHLVPNDDWNVKITFPRDLPLAEWVLRGRAR